MMNRDDIIRWAREAGFAGLLSGEHVTGVGAVYDSGDEEITEMLERFARNAVAAEREACADVCEGHYATDMAARAIRARGET